MPLKKKTPRMKPSNSDVKALKEQIAKLTTKVSRPYSAVGEHVGGMLGFKNLGKTAGGFIGRILGSGDYLTNFDSVKTNDLTKSVPSFDNRTMTIAHREYIQDVVTSSVSGAFTITTFPINPGLNGTYPWLSVIAQNFEEYEINGMIFEFKTMSGQSVASTNTALGSVILATQYDPTKPAFTDKQEMENYDFCQSCKPSESVMHAIDCKKTLSPVKNLYIRTGATTITGPDLRWSDFGNFSIATVGMPGTSVNVGELWCSYSITLRKPRLPSTGLSVQYGSHAYTTGGATLAPLGSVLNYQRGPIFLTITGGNTLSWKGIPGETYLVSVSGNGGVFLANYTVSAVSGCALTNNFNNDTAVGDEGFTAAKAVSIVTVTSTAVTPNQIMSITYATNNVGPVNTDIYVNALDGSVTL